jgi:hypothetical protein
LPTYKVAYTSTGPSKRKAMLAALAVALARVDLAHPGGLWRRNPRGDHIPSPSNSCWHVPGHSTASRSACFAPPGVAGNVVPLGVQQGSEQCIAQA